MDNGPPDSKRPRLTSGPGSWSTTQQRSLPPAGPPPPGGIYMHPQGPPPPPPFNRPDNPSLPPPNIDERDRRHEHDYPPPPHDPHRPPSHVYGSYNGPREPMVKRDPSDETVSMLHSRPHSNGAPDNHATSQPSLPHPTTSSAPPPPISLNYEPPPSTPIQGHGPPPPMSYRPPSTPQYPSAPSPMPQPSVYGHPVSYGQPHRESIYTPPAVQFAPSTQRKKSQRASQACDSCRNLKAKCDEEKPCSNCTEKGLACNYRDPPPKQGDKVQAEMMSMLKTMLNEVHAVKESQAKEFNDFRREFDRFRSVFFSRDPDAERLFKKEPVVENGITAARLHLHTAETNGDDRYATENTAILSSETPTPEHLSYEDEEYGDPAPLGEPTIPVNHTTGAARLLKNPAIASMISDIFSSDKVKNEKYPIIREEKRGLLRLFGRGEGLDLGQGYEKDPAVDHDTDRGDSLSDASPSPAAESRWGQIGGLSPPAGVEIVRRAPNESLGGLSQDGTLELDQQTVYRLVESYLNHMNNMHPILDRKQVYKLVKNFLRNTPEQVSRAKAPVGFVGSTGNGVTSGSGHTPVESPANKRKRSPAATETPEILNGMNFKPRKPQRSISTALVLLILALGKICEHRTKIPDVVQDNSASSHGSPFMRSSARPGSPSSHQHHSPPSASPHSSGLPSPQDMERVPSSRRGSIDLGQQPSLRNLDVIPGLAYFAIATDIIGNQLGGNSLEHVHVNILAGLYHGQLARVLESHTYIHQACRALQSILRPKMERFHRLAETAEQPLPKDNPILFAFWTCLQLESDILAELPCPHSGILSYESIMPYPNYKAALESGLPQRVVDSYTGQLFLRKHLNLLHNTFYRPSAQEDDSKPKSEQDRFLEQVKSMELTLNQFHQSSAQRLDFDENDPPSSDILAARLRAKFYGAQVITYRPFITRILKQSSIGNESTGQDATAGLDDLPLGLRGDSRPITKEEIYYARKCITALENSTAAFHGMAPQGRLIVTNVWGTAHAQWGNMLVLQAAYRDPVLKQFINESKLRELLRKTIAFLEEVQHPSSALNIDLRILKHTGAATGLYPASSNYSFSSNPGT